MLDATKTALEAAGFTVFNNILDHHNGNRTRTMSYIELARTIERTSDVMASGAIIGPFSFRMRVRMHQQWVVNTLGERQGVNDALQIIEKSISAVKVNGMYTEFDMVVEESVATSNTSTMSDYVLSGMLGTPENRSEVSFIGQYFIDDAEDETYYVDDSEKDLLILSIGSAKTYYSDDSESDIYYLDDSQSMKLEAIT